MKKNILFIWYSQTGQLSTMVEKLAEGFDRAEFEMDFCQFRFEGVFPFPWQKDYFFNQMPEVVLGLPLEIHEEPIVFKARYDLVVFAYQPWFLHPSLPSLSIIKNKKVQKVLHNSPVVTLIGARNMWMNAQEKIKAYLREVDAKLVGNVVLVDGAKNLASMVTVQRWMFKGKKDAFLIFPAAGIHQNEINKLPQYGQLIADALVQNQLANLQLALVKQHAVEVKTQLIPLEKRGVRNFKKFAAWIFKAGTKESKERGRREWLFSFLLPKVASLLSPLTYGLNLIKNTLNRAQLLKDKAYFESVDYEENKF